MTTTMTVAGALVAALVGLGAGFAVDEPTTAKERQFLLHASQGQRAEIALGQIATERAANDKVKEFGRQMIDDHAKANEELKQLASQEGVALPKDVELPTAQRERAQRFQQLSGNDFDRAYIGYMLREHTKDVREFEQSASEIQDRDVKDWASKTLPILKGHLKTARNIAEDLGIDMR